MFEWRVEKKSDFYGTLANWWRDHSFPVLAYEAIPRNIFLVSKEGVDLYAVPVFNTDSNWCIIGFPTSNKQASKDLKEGALEYLVGEVVPNYMLIDSGYKNRIIMTTSSNPKLMKIFEDSGFQKAEDNVNYYTKNI